MESLRFISQPTLPEFPLVSSVLTLKGLSHDFWRRQMQALACGFL
jgi:hypothetical protein